MIRKQAQLDLFDSALRAENATLQHTVAWQRSKIAALHEEIGRLRSGSQMQDGWSKRWQDLLAATQHDLEEVRRQLAQVTSDRNFWRCMAQTFESLNTSGRTPSCHLSREAWLTQELRKLLAMAHPDKWSQEQPATALAHEVSAAINTLRVRLREGLA